MSTLIFPTSIMSTSGSQDDLKDVVLSYVESQFVVLVSLATFGSHIVDELAPI